jgi:prenyltransferase beta subunit
MVFDWIPEFKETFEKDAHETYLKGIVKMILTPVCGKYDPHKMLFLYCCLGGLRALGAVLDKNLSDRVNLFIKDCEVNSDGKAFYAPSPFLKFRLEDENGDIITTYLAISCTIMLNEHCISEPRSAMLAKYLDSVFQAKLSIVNIREMYAYCSAYKLLNLDIPTSIAFAIRDKVLELRTYDGAFALEPEAESHAAATFCAVACLKMLNELSAVDIERVKRWAVMRQIEYGFSVG